MEPAEPDGRKRVFISRGADVLLACAYQSVDGNCQTEDLGSKCLGAMADGRNTMGNVFCTWEIDVGLRINL